MMAECLYAFMSRYVPNLDFLVRGAAMIVISRIQVSCLVVLYHSYILLSLFSLTLMQRASHWGQSLDPVSMSHGHIKS